MLDNLQDKRLEDILLAGSITNRTVERGNDDPILVEASGSSSLGGFRKLVKSGDPNLVVTLLKNLPDAGGYNIMPSRS
ncbi:hypothetical protein HY440_03505 [Candidatus Microgenomates bacterium]|nr:hypothetical protein [Candidatus Microgenomates bacterium]